ncbi:MULTISPECIES: glycosyltransferase [unclassified Paenibacillus]|uniref:glycosyltransferase family 2 protein n=1 Tax=unclassified Paenibacillus TaxID=185978 RepID=UPI00240632E1|nr:MULTISPECIES: glycosyltransferase [unclassified Paenibacillus]MDF9844974.1 glycosyltransferase involved in cell wall biosynthesis [Paenibacillus sp. PastF-2]MDF9851573.1 glycosyltransferase involved in cell wall biosynthesis [Paenibacillus sp. PastM-2]MDF9858157.1 glycosyltransferase involved in cell wall biosynthesis [Paenibacillus sp. PastF-1]MDH6483383.1 glycosyltransferase involved in cell wall biosynthesis [Paenibacillus sp. PastH-2]MDH6510833.1 glycosyltransferase involved in cell wal
MPNLSVLMPVYNASRFLRQAVESILCQSYTDFELIIIHDGSTDNSLEILSHFTDPRIKLIDNPVNCGIVTCLNRGFAAASGAYIARMDADDYSLPDRFKAQLEFMNLHPDIGVCGTQYRIIGEAKAESLIPKLPTDPDLLACTLLFHCCLAHPAVMMRRHVLERLDSPPYESSYEHAEDYRLWARLSGITRMTNLKDCHLLYRHHDAQISRTMSPEQLKQAERISLEQLYQFGLFPTAEELEIHLALFSPKRHGDQAERAWVRKILSNNLQVRKFDQAALNEVLSHCI